MSWYIVIQNYYNPVSQHGIASYVPKFESQSFRLVLLAWVLSKRAAGAVSSQGAREGQTLANF